MVLWVIVAKLRASEVHIGSDSAESAWQHRAGLTCVEAKNVWGGMEDDGTRVYLIYIYLIYLR